MSHVTASSISTEKISLQKNNVYNVVISPLQGTSSKIQKYKLIVTEHSQLTIFSNEYYQNVIHGYIS